MASTVLSFPHAPRVIPLTASARPRDVAIVSEECIRGRVMVTVWTPDGEIGLQLMVPSQCISEDFLASQLEWVRSWAADTEGQTIA